MDKSIKMPQTHVDSGKDCYFPEIGLLVFMIYNLRVCQSRAVLV